MADYIYLVEMDIPTELEGEFNRIYDTQHIPCILQVPGVHSCVRYRLEASDKEGVARYAALYEIDSPETPHSDAWKAASDTGDWAPLIRPHTSNRSHLTYRRLG